LWVISELQGGKLQGQSARQALIGQCPGRKLADYPLVIRPGKVVVYVVNLAVDF